MTDSDKTKIIRLEQLEEFKLKNDAKYATKVANATSGNFAGLDANGNPTDSGKKASDFATAAQGTKADNAMPKSGGEFTGVVTFNNGLNITDENFKISTKAEGTAEDPINVLEISSSDEIIFKSGNSELNLDNIPTKTYVDKKYEKPSTGIPNTDLDSGVQTSLRKADTALQAADISGKADKTSTVTNVAWSSDKLTKTINGTTTDVVSASTIKTALNLSKSDVGLSNVTNDAQVKRSEMGVANGVATLDFAGKVPSSQLPSFVDDVLEYDTQSGFPTTGEAGKIYVAKDTNKTYRWSGTAYVEISASIALGETSSTAYRGDRGKTAYDHASAKGSAFASGLYKITTNAEGHVTAATAVVKADITYLGIPAQDTTYSAATQSAAGLMSAADKTKLDGIVYASNSDIDALFA